MEMMYKNPWHRPVAAKGSKGSFIYIFISWDFFGNPNPSGQIMGARSI